MNIVTKVVFQRSKNLETKVVAKVIKQDMFGRWNVRLMLPAEVAASLECVSLPLRRRWAGTVYFDQERGSCL